MLDLPLRSAPRHDAVSAGARGPHQVVEMLEKRVNDLQKELAKFEQVKKFKLLPRAFSMDDGELTPTQKLRRKVINDKYQNEIEEMYKEKSEKK